MNASVSPKPRRRWTIMYRAYMSRTFPPITPPLAPGERVEVMPVSEHDEEVARLRALLDSTQRTLARFDHFDVHGQAGSDT